MQSSNIIPASTPRKLLLINPNSSNQITTLIAEQLASLLKSPIFEIELYTAPSGPPSINSAQDGELSTKIVLKDLSKDLNKYDAFLVACYSAHPLVPMLKHRLGSSFQSVLGIFEASMMAALELLPSRQPSGLMEFGQFGIITTGKSYEKELTAGALDFLADRGKGPDLFFGVESTGLNGSEFHTVDHQLVTAKIKKATKALVRNRKCGVVCLGGGAMVGMEAVVRDALLEELGADERYVHVVDGIGAGIGILEGIEEGQRAVERLTS